MEVYVVLATHDCNDGKWNIRNIFASKAAAEAEAVRLANDRSQWWQLRCRVEEWEVQK